ncbi:MAG TPA: peptidoglycan-binding protein, partial [Virgibacillus sp.]
PLSKGKRHKDTKDLKRDLNKLGYGGIKVTNYFGSFTEKRVKQFQKYYGLKVTGQANKATLSKIKSLLPNPLSKGKRHKDTKDLKRDLNKLGYGGIKVTNYYGSFTEKRVKQFQKYYGLKVTGQANKATLSKIESLLPNPLSKGKRHKDTISLKKKLNQIGYGGIKVTNYYGSFTEKRIKQFQRDYDLPVTGVADEETLAAIDKAMETREKVTYSKYDISLERALDIQMNQLQQTDQYRNKPAYISANYVTISNGVARTTANLNVRASSSTGSHIYGTLPKGSVVHIINKGSQWHKISYNTWRNPTRADVKFYLDPTNNDTFQHLDLTESAHVSARSLNNVLRGKGVLQGLGQAFIDGGNRHSVNEIYLISHALLETGNGSSNLANGIKVGKNNSGHLELVNSSNKHRLTSIKTTYNMFGIGAADSDPKRLGAFTAYKEGWFSPEAAIRGGAKFIGSSYLHNQYYQNTLYKMRWNPANPGYPQYATDIGWAVKQVTQIKNMYNKLDNPLLKFNIVRYL